MQSLLNGLKSQTKELNFPVIINKLAEVPEQAELPQESPPSSPQKIQASGPFKATDRAQHWQKYIGTEPGSGSVLKPNYPYLQKHVGSHVAMTEALTNPREKVYRVPQCVIQNYPCSYKVRKSNREKNNQQESMAELELMTPNEPEQS